MKPRRDATRIAHEILLLCQEDASKTQIVYRVNLNFRLAEKYLSMLLTRGLLSQNLDRHEIRSYHISERGKSLLSSLAHVKTELDTSRLDPFRSIVPTHAPRCLTADAGVRSLRNRRRP